ncbi:MAG: hypothetical protein SNG49_09355 [Rikenellaceae bacterium]
MILTNILLSIIVFYCIVLSFYLFFLHFDISFQVSKRTEMEPQPPPLPKPNVEPPPPPDADSLMGKSTWELRPRAPEVASERQANQGEVKDITFVPEEPKKASARLIGEQVDEAFKHNQFEADFEVETAVVEEAVVETTEEQELTEAGFDPNMQASGFELSELNKANETLWKPSSSVSDKITAGELFYKLKGSDIAKQLESANDQMGRKIDEVIAFHLNKLHEEEVKDESAPNSSDVGNFDIDNYL